MREASLSSDSRAVSPVIGAVLMVTITILLAVTTATFFLGFGEQAEQNRAPTAAFTFDYEADASGERVTVRHASGDTLERRYVHLVVSGAACDGAPSEDPNGRYAYPASRSEVVAGMRATLDTGSLCGGSGSLVVSEAEVTVVWTGPPNVNSKVLTRWRGPKA